MSAARLRARRFDLCRATLAFRLEGRRGLIARSGQVCKLRASGLEAIACGLKLRARGFELSRAILTGPRRAFRLLLRFLSRGFGCCRSAAGRDRARHAHEQRRRHLSAKRVEACGPLCFGRRLGLPSSVRDSNRLLGFRRRRSASNSSWNLAWIASKAFRSWSSGILRIIRTGSGQVKRRKARNSNRDSNLTDEPEAVQ